MRNITISIKKNGSPSPEWDATAWEATTNGIGREIAPGDSRKFFYGGTRELALAKVLAYLLENQS